jgi:tRNA(adenine34) deaminase
MYEWMQSALNEAKIAFSQGDVPVGAVLVRDGRIVSVSHNNSKSPIAHAELMLINEALTELNTRSLKGCELYVTLEPCIMCAGAIYYAGVSKLVYGAYDYDLGAYENFNIPKKKDFKIMGGIMEMECEKLLKDFFLNIRGNQR